MIQIKHRYTRAVIFEHEGPAIKDAVIAAVQARAAFAGANLAGADLAGAYLAGAILAGANLEGANLADAYLADAYLADAYYDPSKHSEPKERERRRLASDLEASRAEVERLRRGIRDAHAHQFSAASCMALIDLAKPAEEPKP